MPFMRRLGAILVLAGAALPLPAPKPKLKPEDLPRVSKVQALGKMTPFERVTVELDDQGQLFVDGRLFTLNEVGAHVLRYSEERAGYRKRQKEEPYDTLPSGIEGSNVRILLRVHKDAPWRHVQWLLSLLAEQRAYKTEFLAVDGNGREGTVPAWLPLDEAAEGGIVFPEDDADETTTAPREKQNTLTATVIAEGKRAITFAGKPAEGPASLAWALDRRKTADREKFFGWLREEAGGKRTLDIRAHAKAPAGEVVAIVDAARAAGSERIDLYHAEIASRAERGLKRLPYPD